MRLMLASMVLCLGCVSSSIQLGEEDAGPRRDARALPDTSSMADVPVIEEDAPRPDVDMCTLAPPLHDCYDDECILGPGTIDDLCTVLECNAAPAHCFDACDDHRECIVGAECCTGINCGTGFVARNTLGDDLARETCGEPDVPRGIVAFCNEARFCELVDFADCSPDDMSPGQGCAAVPRIYPGCAEDVAANRVQYVAVREDKVGTYFERACSGPAGERDPCCLEPATNNAYCTPEGRCEVDGD